MSSLEKGVFTYFVENKILATYYAAFVIRVEGAGPKVC